MRIGYFMNTYPLTSTTFIRREIEALEELGLPIKRYAIRRWSEDLVDDRDRAEQEQTRYVLSGRTAGLITDFFKEIVTNPVGLARAIKSWGALMWNAGGRVVPHVAYLLEAVSLRRMAAADGIDHIHTHFSTNSAAVALLCHRLGGPGYSFTAHGPNEFIDWGPSSLAMKVEHARFVAAITHFATVQLTLAAGIEAWDKIHIVGCGLDLEEFEVSDAPFTANAPFVSVGRLCPEKAQVLIVEAVAKVVATHPDIRVQLIGGGDDLPKIEAAIARHGVAENIELLGWRDNHEVRERLGKARALLLPSFAEGLPVVIMEALAVGRPAISTYIAGIPELVDDGCGWIIPAGAPDEIAKAMIAALDTAPDTLAALGQEGRRRITERHDVKKNAAKLADLFRQAVAHTEVTA